MSPLLLGEILRVFVNTLTSDGKYPVLDCENSPLPIQMQLSGKPKTLSQKKRIIVIANVFSELQAVKILIRPLSKKRRFGTRFDSQHVKASQVLAKSQ